MDGKLALLSLVMMTSAISNVAQADSEKSVYELQERCGRRAAEWFKKEYGDGISNTKDAQVFSNFRNHYNPLMHKCFLLLISNSISHRKDKTEKISSTQLETIYDLNDNNE